MRKETDPGTGAEARALAWRELGPPGAHHRRQRGPALCDRCAHRQNRVGAGGGAAGAVLAGRGGFAMHPAGVVYYSAKTGLPNGKLPECTSARSRCCGRATGRAWPRWSSRAIAGRRSGSLSTIAGNIVTVRTRRCRRRSAALRRLEPGRALAGGDGGRAPANLGARRGGGCCASISCHRRPAGCRMGTGCWSRGRRLGSGFIARPTAREVGRSRRRSRRAGRARWRARATIWPLRGTSIRRSRSTRCGSRRRCRRGW